MIDPDELHRTVKLEIDDGRAETLAEAEALAHSYRLHIAAGPEVASSPAVQAALLTAVAAGSRAFLGGVEVRLDSQAQVLLPWMRGEHLEDAVRAAGGRIVGEVDPVAPLIQLGAAQVPTDATRVVYIDADGWTARVHRSPAPAPTTTPFVLAGVLAGALGASELFQHVRGDARAGRRNIDVNLWNPAARHLESGPALPYLPSRLWIVGLGHLGQAYAWALGMLPYEQPSELSIVLQDTDAISVANFSTGLLSDQSNVGQPKTRAISRQLERNGFRTAIVERWFDEFTRPGGADPSWVLGALDDPAPRRWLFDAGFARYVDAGIGADATNYLDILVQTFPSQQTLDAAFPRLQAKQRTADAPAYRRLVTDALAAGAAPGDAQCGAVEIAGRSVGAAFVGVAAACLVLADVLRALNGAPVDLAIANLDLRDPARMEVASNTAPGSPSNPGYTTSALPKSSHPTCGRRAESGSDDA